MSAERTKVSKTERLLNLISYMLRSPHPVPFSQIAGHVVGYDDEARLDSIEKRFDRDKAELRNMGIPVEYIDTGDPDTAGYVIPKDRFFLGHVSLSGDDGLLLAAAARSGGLEFLSPLMRDAFRSALRKLSVDLPELEQRPHESASVLQISSGMESASENLQVICAAVYARRRIRFDYVGNNDQAPQKRRVDPYGYGLRKGEWYLFGFCHDRGGERSFRVSRIRGAVSLIGASDAGQEFDIPMSFNVADRLPPRDPWNLGDAKPRAIRVEVTDDVALQLRHQTGLEFEVREQRDGRSVLEFSVRRPEAMIDWIISLAGEARLLAPDDLVAALRSRLDSMAGVYAERGGEAHA